MATSAELGALGGTRCGAGELGWKVYKGSGIQVESVPWDEFSVALLVLGGSTPWGGLPENAALLTVGAGPMLGTGDGGDVFGTGPSGVPKGTSAATCSGGVWIGVAGGAALAT